MTFKDHFSCHAAQYATFRPKYPDELFAYLARLARSQECAWDCATGSGQAAIGLAGHFRKVIATDASVEQIANADLHERIEYRVAPAEQSGLPRHSIDLITVAQALHWLDLARFFNEARRVLKSGGVLAAWAYQLAQIRPDLDAVIDQFYRETTGAYWPPERQMVESGYQNIEFPFEELHAPVLAMTARWTLDQLMGYVSTWSAVKGFIAARGFDPVHRLREQLQDLWQDPSLALEVKWPLRVRLGISNSCSSGRS